MATNQNINHVDHILWLSHYTNQERYARQLSALCGVELQGPNVRHDLGTCNWVSWEGGLEVVAPLDGVETPFNKLFHDTLAQRGEGLFGVVFGVPDMEEARARARELGYTPSELLGPNGNEPWAGKTVKMQESVVGTVLNSLLVFGEIEYREGVFTTQRSQSALADQ